MYSNLPVKMTCDGIIMTACAMLDKGLIAGTWGNVSARIPHSSYIAITPSGRDYTTLVTQDIVIVDEKGSTVGGKLKPSSELPLHLAIYNKRADVKSIVHTHSIFASACAVAHQAIPPIIEDLVQVVGGEVEVAEYAFPGTEGLGAKATKALGEKNAVLLANHGMVGCGQSLKEAMLVCELIEKAAQIYIYARQIGTPQVLSAQDIDAMHQFYKIHYRQLQGGLDE